MSEVTIPQHWQTLLAQHQAEGLLANGFPNRKWEAWKYTDLSALLAHPFEYNVANNTVFTGELPAAVDAALRIVFVDGVLVESALLPNGVQLQGFLDCRAGAHNEQQVTHHSMPSTVQSPSSPEVKQSSPLQRATQSASSRGVKRCGDPGSLGGADSPFVVLNQLLANSGVVLKVNDAVILTQPIHLLFISTQAQTDKMQHWTNQIHLGKHASASIIEEYVSLTPNCYFNNIVSTISLADGAQLQHYKLQSESNNAYHIASTQVQQQQHSHYSNLSLSLGALLSRDDLQVALTQSGAECQLNGLYLAKHKQHIDHHTSIYHQASHCESHQLYKGIASEQARVVFNGKIIVDSDIIQTVAHQANHNLLLSNQAEIDTKPELQIDADDVQCSHGATVGQLDEKALFYLQSRGVDEAQARVMLMQAFSEEIILQVADMPIQQYLHQALLRKE